MKLLITAATSDEINAIKKWIKAANIKKNLDIDYLCCWIGNYETILNLENYISKYSEPIFIRNIWICGYWNHDNQKKNIPIQAATTFNIHTEKEFVIPPFVQIAPMRNCFSSEKPIKEKPYLKKEIECINDEWYFDMESRWTEFVSLRHKLPHIILKVPLDFVWQETLDLYDNKWKFIWKDVADCLEKLPYHDYLQKIIEWIESQ